MILATAAAIAVVAIALAVQHHYARWQEARDARPYEERMREEIARDTARIVGDPARLFRKPR